jgi:hypothetical protein
MTREAISKSRAATAASDIGLVYGTAMNIREVDGDGRVRVGWCFVPKGYLVAGDVMLAQKIALETDERGALAAANRFFVP